MKPSHKPIDWFYFFANSLSMLRLHDMEWKLKEISDITKAMEKYKK